MMLPTSWSPNNSSGVPAMDQLHRDLFGSLARLSKSEDSEFANDYKALLCQVERAFDEEQQWMEEIDFPSLRAHQEQHARVLGALHTVHARVMDGELALGREVIMNLLPQWLGLHISTMDRSLALEMQMHQARIAWSRNVGGPAKEFRAPH